jgi:predicted exporter
LGEDTNTIWGGSAYATAWGGLANKGAIAVVFDSVCGIDILLQQALSDASSRVNQPLAPSSPLYFLIATRSDIEANANTLSSDQALWVAVHPQTGRVSISPNVAQTGTDATALRAARAKARALLAVGK